MNVGQTVVSSLNAPSLFLIAKDLTRMQVWASVNEADIGNIHSGQSVKFTVDAYPGETFGGTVVQIRLNATMTQNVVTYTVVVNADNTSGKLLPYLRELTGTGQHDSRDTLAAVFKETYNRMLSGYLLRDVVNKVNEVNFNSSDDIHTMAHLYESMLREVRDAAGDSGS